MDTTPAIPKLEKLDEKTVQKIDYIIRGLELGKFDETSKKVEFLGKLSGDPAPGYIEKLLSRISQLEKENGTLESDNIRHESKIIEIEANHLEAERKITALEDDMTTVAKAIQYFMHPDPLGSSYELSNIEAFLSNKGVRKF